MIAHPRSTEAILHGCWIRVIDTQVVVAHALEWRPLRRYLLVVEIVKEICPASTGFNFMYNDIFTEEDSVVEQGECVS